MIGITLQNYFIESVLGEGGMGRVYKATDTVLGRVVAIKCLSGTLTNQPSFLERFKNEAKTLARLAHPNIAVIYNYLQIENDFYMVMEYVEGENLDQLTSRHNKLPYQAVVPLMVQALDGLAHAHSKGVLHRDIKPANLMLTALQTIKLMDFGIARVSDQAKLTQVSRVIGTLEFLAPEIIEGQEPSIASDIYAAGVVMYELLAGKLPFTGKSDYMLMQDIVKTKPVVPENWSKEVPAKLSEIVLKSLEKKPEDRFASATEFRQALKAAFPELTQIPSGLLLEKASSGQEREAPAPTVVADAESPKLMAETTVIQPAIPATTILHVDRQKKWELPQILKNKLLYLGLAALLIIGFALFKILSPGSENRNADKDSLALTGSAALPETNNFEEEDVARKRKSDSQIFILNKKKEEEALLAQQEQSNQGGGNSDGSRRPGSSSSSNLGDNNNASSDKPSSEGVKPKPKPQPEEEISEGSFPRAMKLRIPITIALRENITRASAREGQHVSFKVTAAGKLRDKVIIPAGSVIHGTIKGLGSRRMSIIFNSVTVRGRNLRLERSEIGASMETVFSGNSFKTGLKGILNP